jgi:diacylglycerol kinase family enzyme
LESHATIAQFRQIAREAVAAQAEAVLVAGGDGSLNLVAAELAGSNVALGVLPIGTANVWAKEIGLPLPAWSRPEALARAALTLLDGETRWTDLGECNGHKFLLWAGVGLDAFVMHRLSGQRLFSRQLGLAYNVLATFFIGAEWRGFEARVTAGGRELAGRYLLAVAANVNEYGGTFRFGDTARLDDGQLDVWLFAGDTYAEALAHSARLFAGKHAGHSGVTHLTSDRLEIHLARPQWFHADGEPFTPAERISIQVVPRALRVLVPAKAGRDLFSSAE